MIDFMQSGRVSDITVPPAPFLRTSSGVVALRRGGGMIALFGSPFVAGVCMLLGATGIVPGYTESGEHAAPVILGPMGFVFLAVGGVMAFGRQWLILDLGRGSLLRQTGLLVPLWTNERPLSEFNAVVLAHDPGGSDSAESYPVKLRGSVGEDIKIVDPSQFTESLRMAEYLAKTLRLPLIDSTTGHETVVSPDHTGESLRDRLSRGPMPAPPRRPSTMRSVVVEIAGETSISIPGRQPHAGRKHSRAASDCNLSDCDAVRNSGSWRLRQDKLLQADDSKIVLDRGEKMHAEWSASRAAMLASGTTPRMNVATATELALAAPADGWRWRNNCDRRRGATPDGRMASASARSYI